jgi:hypothetical protein
MLACGINLGAWKRDACKMKLWTTIKTKLQKLNPRRKNRGKEPAGQLQTPQRTGGDVPGAGTTVGTTPLVDLSGPYFPPAAGADSHGRIVDDSTTSQGYVPGYVPDGQGGMVKEAPAQYGVSSASILAPVQEPDMVVGGLESGQAAPSGMTPGPAAPPSPSVFRSLTIRLKNLARRQPIGKRLRPSF